jgi:hypothetical protein
MPGKILAGRPSAVQLHAPSPIPPDTALTLWLRGPKTYRGHVAERKALTKDIEAHCAVRIAGDYTVLVEDAEKRVLIKDKLRVVAWPAHTALCHLDAKRASSDGLQQLLCASDAFGNRHTCGGERFEAAYGASTPCRVSDNGDGTYNVQLPNDVPTGPGQLRVWQRSSAPTACKKTSGGGDMTPEGDTTVAELGVCVQSPSEKPSAVLALRFAGSSGLFSEMTPRGREIAG